MLNQAKLGIKKQIITMYYLCSLKMVGEMGFEPTRFKGG